MTRIEFRWFTFTSRDEKFTFELPKKELYIRENNTQTTDEGNKIELEHFGLIDDNQIYLVTYYKNLFAGLDGNEARLKVSEAALGYVSDDEAIVARKHLTFEQNGAGIFGEEIIAENKDGSTKHFRYLSEGENGYLMVANYPTTKKSISEYFINTKDFFNSFSVKK